MFLSDVKILTKQMIFSKSELYTAEGFTEQVFIKFSIVSSSKSSEKSTVEHKSERKLQMFAFKLGFASCFQASATVIYGCIMPLARRVLT